jgi:GTP-binding protein
LLDTAGVSKSVRKASGVPYYSSLRTSEAIRRSDVSLLLVDAVEGIVAGDLRVAREIRESGRACGVLVNKRDLVPPERLREVDHGIAARLTDLKPRSLPISALTGAGVDGVLPLASLVGGAYRLRVPTHEVAEFVNALVDRNAPPGA